MHLISKGNKQGELVVFLHGVGSSSHMWEKHLAAFNNFNCIAPDLPGHGKSNKLAWTTLDDVADQLSQLVNKSGYKKAHFVGLSLGGSLIINILGRHPEIVDHAVVDGAGIIPIKGKDMIKLAVKLISPFIRFDVINSQITKSLGIINQKEITQFRKDMQLVSPQAFSTAFAQANDQAEPAHIKMLNIPVLFMAGEHEAEETKASNTYLAKTIRGSQTEIIKGMGHGWVAKKPGLHIKMVKDWLENSFNK